MSCLRGHCRFKMPASSSSLQWLIKLLTLSMERAPPTRRWASKSPEDSIDGIDPLPLIKHFRFGLYSPHQSYIQATAAQALSDSLPRRVQVYATTLVALSSSTALLGGALILTGRLRLAGLVQYLPLPVVGGYLAYIGLYCFEAGLSLMSGHEVRPRWRGRRRSSLFAPASCCARKLMHCLV
eukprot:scaffold154273_cov37-Tisochrysis_lutea.AAC.4